MDKTTIHKDTFHKSSLTVDTLKNLTKIIKLLIENFNVRYEVAETTHTICIKTYILKRELKEDEARVIKEVVSKPL